MNKKIGRILAINFLPSLVYLGLLSSYIVFIFFPELENNAATGGVMPSLSVPFLPYTLGLTAAAVIFIITAVRTAGIEISREKMKKSFELIDKEYQNWVETTADGFIYISNDGNVSTDNIVAEMLGYTVEELKSLKPSMIINRDTDGVELLENLERDDDEITGRYETRLVHRNGSFLEVVISASRINSGEFRGFILLIKDMSDNVRTHSVRIDIQREYAVVELQSALQYIYQNAGSMMVEPLLVNEKTEIINAVEKMNNRHVNTFIVIDENGFARGIVTDQDLRQRVLSGTSGIHSPVNQIMSSPVVTAAADIMFFEAFRLMRDNSIRQLLITDDDARPVGLLTEKKLIEVQSTNAAAFMEELMKAGTLEELRDCYIRLVFSVRTLVLSGSKAAYIINLVSKTSEVITHKLIEKGIVKYGPPSCRFTFLALGSEGRGEQTLLTDQDNAIIFDDVSDGSLEACRNYFLKLGSYISESLNYIGYTYCSGGVMASNPKWVKSKSEWHYQVVSWFAGESSERLLDLNILFDFKYIYGDRNLSRELRQIIWDAVNRYPGFLREVADAVSVFKPPLTALGRIQVKYTEKDDEVFDIKKALGPLIIYARTMALREKIEATSTAARLLEIKERELISEHQYRNYLQAFDFLTQLRFRDQVQTIEDGEELNNLIYIEDLTEVEILSIRRIFRQIASAQDRLRILLTGNIR